MTKRPLNFAGDISAMYIGPKTEDPPIPIPPMNRNMHKDQKSQARAHPKAEIMKSTPSIFKLSRLPQISPGFDEISVPSMVPIKAEDTTKPIDHSDNWNRDFTAEVVPEITAVSKPNNKPPNEATIAARINVPVIL